MKKYNLKRKGMAAAALTLAFGMLVPSVSFAAGTPVNVLSGTESQMSSDKEVVYVNNYSAAKRDVNFNDNWKFYLGDASGAEEPAFDDSKWEHVNLPHDYSIEQEYSTKMEAESGYLPGGIGWYRKSFTLGKTAENRRVRIDFGGVYMDATVWVNGTQVGSHPYGYTPFSFDITDLVKFDGENVITVKVNHQTPSSRWYSGSGIYRSVDLNIVNPVHVDLYGTKVETPNLETEKGGAVTTNIKTTVANDSDREQNVTLTHTIFKKGGEPSANIGTVTTETKAIAAGETAAIDATVNAQNPELWSTTNPALYTVRTEVKIGEEVVDTYDTEYGFRYFKFDENSGFSLNGTNMKLKGVCMHHDQGALGAEAWERAIERQVEILKEMGCNSIRVTHNPAAEELINICNEKGILVVEEMFDGWQNAKNGNNNDYARFFNQTIGESNQILGKENGMTWAKYDLTAAVKRGWNAPSIIMWSLGNEVQEGATGVLTQAYANVQANLIDWTTALDTTRPATRGDNVLKGNKIGIPKNMMDAMTTANGTVGLNYCSGNDYDTLHNSNPNWKLYGSETASAVNSRGVYDRIDGSKTGQKLTSYDNSAVNWGAVASSAWYEVIKRDFVAGEYVWTGFDYIGEPTPWNGTGKGAQGTWPSPKNSYFGIIDTAGFPKDSYYFYQSQWNDEVNTLHILPAWNEDAVKKDSSGKVPVVVYTDAKKVELFFTDAKTGDKKSLGTKEFTQKQSNTQGYTYQYYEGTDKSGTEHKNLYLTWQVPYKAGTISAVAYGQDGQKISEEKLNGRTSVTTTGEKKNLKATVDRDTIAADGADLTYVTVDVTDKDGNIIPNAEDKVTFKVEGEGKLVGIDNGRQDDHTSYQANSRNAFAGKVLAIVQSTKKAGSITVTASAKGLETSSVTVTTTSVEQDTTGEKAISYYEMSKNYYVKTGNMPQLPSTVKAVYKDGSEKEIPVTWDAITEEQIAQSGTFSVAGTTEAGDTLTVIVNMIDQVVSLLNYSTTVPLGTKPTLPESRPAVLQDGEVMNASFPVAWGEPNGSYDAEGIVTVKGTADVLGQNVEVTATIRVEKQKIELGSSVSSAAYLSQDVPEGQQSDTLDAIKDGKKEIGDNNSGGANPTCWSNWATRNTDPTSEITFRYATQQRVGKIVVYYSKDNGAMTFPREGRTKLFVSETGDEGSWKELSVEETIAENESPERVKAYTYTFDPTVATFVKLQVTNTTPQEAGKTETCTGITEVEIIEWNGSYTTNSTANLSKLTVNGLELSEEELAAGSFDTEAIVIDTIDYVAADNAAVTYVPPYENKAKLIIESEDHTTRNEFVINLDGKGVGNTDPVYAGRDYDTQKMSVTAGSEQSGQGNEGPARYVLDGNEGTIWHTSWNPQASRDTFWIKFELNEITSLDALRYKGRGGASNGRISKYRVEVSKDDQNWTEVSVGNWDNTDDWYIAMFNEPTEAKYVRLTGVETYGEGSQQNKFASAAEIRLRKADSKTDISDATVSLTNEKKLVSVVDKDHPVTLSKEDIEVTLGDKVLRYGIDYKLTYNNNEAPGTATAIVTGIGQYGYTGSQEVSFTIELKKPEMNNISIKSFPTKTTYKEGETLDPTGLVLTTSYDNGTTADVVYSEETAKDFAFNPDTKTALSKGNTKVTVTYGGFETEFAITVTEAKKPDPEKPDPEKPGPEKPDPEKPDPEKPSPEKPDPEKPDPEKPNPEKPNPEKPDSGNQGSGKPDGNGSSKGNTGNTNNSNNAVQTGDTASVGICVVALAAAGIVGIVGAIMIGKKRKDVK